MKTKHGIEAQETQLTKVWIEGGRVSGILSLKVDDGTGKMVEIDTINPAFNQAKLNKAATKFLNDCAAAIIDDPVNTEDNKTV